MVTRFRGNLETQIVNVSVSPIVINISGYIFKHLGLVLVSLTCEGVKPMSNFVLMCRNKSFMSTAMPVPSSTGCCICDKCMKNGSLAYMWHLKRNKIYLHIIKLYSAAL